MARPAPRFQPRLDTLEAREVPAIIAEAFDQVRAPSLPAGWSQWSNTGADGYVTTRITSADKGNSLASTGTTATESRFWYADPVQADTTVSARLLSDSPAPELVIARGRSLGSKSPSYVAAVVSPTARQVRLVEVKDGVTRVLGTVNGRAAVYGQWLTVTVRPVGEAVAVQVQRPDIKQYLSPAGVWQTAPVDAILAASTWLPATGQVGLGRAAGGQGMTFVDGFVATTPPAIHETFDAVPVAGLPVNWKEWTSDGTAGFGATAARAVSGNGFAAAGTSVTTARAWVGSPQPADVQASASVYADSLIPASLVIRGANLDSARPTFYALTVARGLDVRLVRTVDGVETALGAIKSKDYVSGKWVRVTLTAVGDQLRAVVFRTDTGRWLTPDGTWSDTPQPALERTDTGIRSEGFVGLNRAASYSGTVTFDDVDVKPASDATGPKVTVTANLPVAGVVGDVTFKVSAPGARRVEFRLNDRLRSAAAAATADWTLDTTTLANGLHTLVVRAVDEAGNVGTATVQFVTNNPNPAPPPDRPELPRKLPSIRIAQLAYDGTPMGAFELARLKDSVDLVIPNPKYLDAIDKASPTTPQVIYSNATNLYQGLLTDWLGYADKNGLSRELAFYHVTQPTPFTGNSPSSRPVSWLWQVTRTPSSSIGTAVDLTSAATGGRLFGVQFGKAGEAVAFGYPDRFRELNVDLKTTAAGGWQGAVDYVSAVDANGNPTAWKPLPLRQDGTYGLTASGQITFDPPPDWVAARINGGERLFHVRVRTTASPQGAVVPEARTVFGRDYVGANGTTKGTIPAFDAAADADADGYLSDAEYAGRRAGFDARFVYESRLFHPQYGQMRFVVNPPSSAVRRWAADFHTRLLAQYPQADGVFLDNSSGRLPFAGVSVIEPTASYSEDSGALTAAVWRAVAPKTVWSNTVGGQDDATPTTRASTGAVEEFLLRPAEANWSAVLDTASLVAGRLAADSPSPYVVLDSYSSSLPTTDPRLKLGVLAYYYLVGDPDRTFLMLFGGQNPAAAWSATWVPAVGTDIGQPAGGMTTFATGADPQNPALGYKVFRRDYGKAVVLYKPRSYTLGVGTGTLDDATATTHDLGGSYRVLNADGTLGAVVTSVTLRNGEGAILMKA
ncbi:MAG: Ig-like domain-containing protein [Gemmataceae bacterium]